MNIIQPIQPHQPVNNKMVYVVGFLFDWPITSVVLIRKTAKHVLHTGQTFDGMLNGVGGKVRHGETQQEAMRREFAEEAGLHVDLWTKFLILNVPGADIHFFRAFTTLACVTQAKTMTDEEIIVCNPNSLPGKYVKNLNYIIPMAMDRNIRQASIYEFEVIPKT